jgi:sarcosine oxidase subunit delta
VIQLPCPWCGLRNATEFRHAGEATPRPDPASTTPEQWRAYLYLRRNPRGRVTETWYHTAGCRRYFRLERDTRSNRTRSDESRGPR